MSPQPAGVCLPETHVPKPLRLTGEGGARASAAPQPREDTWLGEERHSQQMGKGWAWTKRAGEGPGTCVGEGTRELG